ncbi:MAG: tyrosine--tRNA ligase [Bacteroidota bacterium]
MKNVIKELEWRGMVHDFMPGTEEQLSKENTAVYLGIDPTADSLHIGHLASIMLLRHFQEAGHKPIVLVGGATGMIGDPSGKSQERNLLDINQIRHNEEQIKQQLKKFIDFNDPETGAEMVNNYDWISPMSFIDFIRDIGKHITINYMVAKDAVKKRLESGLSFTEFSYQLVQGFDFYHLYQEKNCKVQIGGADQWGNITTGTELIRRKCGGEAYALTCPLITRADGGKFGKTEEGNIWLNPNYTSPYKFYQFWLNVSDEDAIKYIKIFTLLSEENIKELVIRHQESPHERLLQKKLAEEITVLVHSEEAYQTATEASQILFGKGTVDSLKKLDEATFYQIFDGVPVHEIEHNKLTKGCPVLDFLSDETGIIESKGEARRLIKGGGLSINKEKVQNQEQIIQTENLLNGRYMLIQKGKKNYFIVRSK